MRTIRETLFLLFPRLQDRLKWRRWLTRRRPLLGSYNYMTAGRWISESWPSRLRRVALRSLVLGIGPRRVIMAMHEAGAIYPCWGADANGSSFFGWVESTPPDPDEEADRG